MLPDEPALTLKGVAVALADGISSSRVSGVASSVAVRNFLADYYCTPDAWSVRTSVNRVVAAVNAWLHAETKSGEGAEDRDRGYVCTLDLLVIKGRAAHLFHVGDGRIWRVAGSSLEQLTRDHRVTVSSAQSYLARALGAEPRVEIDYRQLTVAPGEVFVLSTDGVHDHLAPETIAAAIGNDLEASAADIVARAHAAGSPDNLTVQLVRIDALPAPGLDHLLDQAADLPPAPLLEPGQSLDGFRVVRTLHDSARSHLYLATDPAGTPVVLKIPSVDLGGDAAYLRRFMMEEWIARRIDSPYIVRHRPPETPRSRLYLVLEYVDGQTLAQWMRDNAAPSLESVRAIIEQIARGLDAFHRREMTHGDLRPENVMIDEGGRARLLDFGSCVVPGVTELEPGAAPARTTRNGAILRLRVAAWCRRDAGLRRLFPGPDRLPHADRAVAVWRGPGASAECGRARQAALPVGTRGPADAAELGGRGATQGGASIAAAPLRGGIGFRAGFAGAQPGADADVDPAGRGATPSCSGRRSRWPWRS